MSFTTKSRRLPVASVHVTDSFWSRWQKTVAEVTIPTQFAQLEQTGRLETFRRVARGESGGFEGFWFNDSDVYKWIEACALSLHHFPLAANRAAMEEAIRIVAAAQEPSGYLNTFFQLGYPHLKWKALWMGHEMYCGGHLIEAACAHFDLTGGRTLLDVAIRWADHVMGIFGPGLRLGVCGHEESELALIKLAKATGDAKYREYARWQMEMRGQKPSPFEAEIELRKRELATSSGFNLFYREDTYDGEYCQDHLPIREQTTVVGHAVRAMYLYIAATQLASGCNDSALENALISCWRSLTERRMYVTGGIGPSGKNEGFTFDYDLPNHSAYAETCAAIGLALWGRRLFEQTADASYLDTMELALYNGALSGISLDGDRYFYVNPLESRSDHEREPWFSCACCPPNIARLIGQVGQLAVGESDDGVWLNMPVGMVAETRFGTLRVDSNYPWSGKFEVCFDNCKETNHALRIRKPDWCSAVTVDGQPREWRNGWLELNGPWPGAQPVTIEFEMLPCWLRSKPEVLENIGRVALKCGPLVYCLESLEVEVPQRFSVDVEAELGVRWAPDVLDGVNTIEVSGAVISDCVGADLYFPVVNQAGRSAKTDFIPYFAWNNRGKSHMQVWVRES